MINRQPFSMNVDMNLGQIPSGMPPGATNYGFRVTGTADRDVTWNNRTWNLPADSALWQGLPSYDESEITYYTGAYNNPYGPNRVYQFTINFHVNTWFNMGGFKTVVTTSGTAPYGYTWTLKEGCLWDGYKNARTGTGTGWSSPAVYWIQNTYLFKTAYRRGRTFNPTLGYYTGSTWTYNSFKGFSMLASPATANGTQESTDLTVGRATIDDLNYGDTLSKTSTFDIRWAWAHANNKVIHSNIVYEWKLRAGNPPLFDSDDNMPDPQYSFWTP